MNKTELIDAVTTSTKLSRKQVESVVNEVLMEIQDTVARGEKVVIVDFGSFQAKKRKAREGRNPKTGEKIHIPVSIKPVFTAGKAFKDKVTFYSDI